MDDLPRVVLLSRLSIHGETLYKALQGVSTVKWIARKSEFRKDPFKFPLRLILEFSRLLVTCRSVPHGGRRIVVVCSPGFDAILAFAVRRVTGCKVLLYAVGPESLGARKLGRKPFLKWAVRNADVVLCGNSMMENKVRSLGGRDTRFLPTPFLPLEQVGKRNKEFDIVTVGRLDESAKLNLLVEASAYLDPSMKIAIVGGGPEREYLMDLSRRHGRTQVYFLGDLSTERVYRTLRSSSLYVQCSSDEGAQASVLAAADCGLPILELDGDRDRELTELVGLKPIVPEDRLATSLANAIEGAMANYSTLLEDVSRNRDALESYARSWPEMAVAAISS